MEIQRKNEQVSTKQNKVDQLDKGYSYNYVLQDHCEHVSPNQKFTVIVGYKAIY